MKKYLFVLALFLTISCSDNGLSNFGKFGYQACRETGKKLSKEKNLSLSALGGGCNNNKEQMLSINLHSKTSMNLEQARELTIYCIQQFLNDINNSTKLRPYLEKYPFTVENINILILCLDKNGSFQLSPYIASTSIREGFIDYRFYENKHLKSIHNETYEKALEILNKKEL